MNLPGCGTKELSVNLIGSLGDDVEVAVTLGSLASAHGALGDSRTQRAMLERELAIEEPRYRVYYRADYC